MKKYLSFCLLVFCACANAADLPDLGNQAAWGEKEKKEFLDYLKTNKQIPAGGQVKYVSPEKSAGGSPSKAGYLTLNVVTDTMLLDEGGGKTKTETANIGPKLILGGHMFSWVRYYTGFKYTAIGQNRLNGGRARLSHSEIPLGIELALIPLGTPQTRYILLRGGVSAHYISGASKSDFASPILGWRAAWNLGAGYEWQIPDSRWRINILTEAYRAFSSKGPPRFSGLGLTSGLAYTF